MKIDKVRLVAYPNYDGLEIAYASLDQQKAIKYLENIMSDYKPNEKYQLVCLGLDEVDNDAGTAKLLYF